MKNVITAPVCLGDAVAATLKFTASFVINNTPCHEEAPS
jgi:hypothetical protein